MGNTKSTPEGRIRSFIRSLTPDQRREYDWVANNKDKKLADLDRLNREKLKQKNQELEDLTRQLKMEEEFRQSTMNRQLDEV